MERKILNVKRDEVFKLLIINVHVYCFNVDTKNIFDLYDEPVSYIHTLLYNDRVVFFEIGEV